MPVPLFLPPRSGQVAVGKPASHCRLHRLGWAVVLLWLVGLGPAIAQQYTFRGYGQPDGLGNLSVTCLLQDRAGYLWVGTENGMYRRDGRELQHFGESDGLHDTLIHGAVVDTSGRLWVATSHDLYRFDGQRFSAVRPDGHALSIAFGSRLASRPGNRLLVINKESLLELIPDADGRSWHSHPYFDTGQLTATPALAHLSSLYTDARDRLWLACGGRICSVEHGQVSSWDDARGVPEDEWHSWTVDSQQRLWVRGLKHLLALDPAAVGFVEQNPPHAVINSGVYFAPVIEDRQGSIITRTDLGLARWRQNEWEEITADSGLPITAISALLATADGTMWLGMSGGGLWRWLGYGTFESWTPRRGLERNPVWAVVRDADNTLTMGSSAGCMHIQPRSRSAQPCDFEGLPSGEIQVMARDGTGNLWIGASTGPLYRVAAGQRRAVHIADIPLMRGLFVDSEGRLWISTNTTLQVVQRGSTQLTRETLPEGLGEIQDISQDDRGVLWIATQGGLLQRTNGVWRLLELHVPAPEGFSSIVGTGQGWFWAAGAAHGIMRLHVSGAKADFAQWQTSPNIADAAVYFNHVDHRGWLWLGTDAGIVLYDGRRWRKFDQADGLIWNDTDQNSAYEDEDGSLWMGTSGGLAHVIQPEALINEAPLDLRIGKLTVGTRQIDAAPRPSIPWRQNLPLDVHLQELNFAVAEKTHLKVRLRGLSDDWFETRDFDIHYPALSPGQYSFEAFAENPDQQRTSALIRRDFVVLPPWWQTSWFRALVTATVLALAATAWRWRVAKLERRRLRLERALRERAALLERATRDPLTKLWNRQAILEILAQAMESAKAEKKSLAVALIDIDHFKRVNDTMGHLAGDAVLRSMAEQIVKRTRAGDSLGRYGGEELLLVLPNAAPQKPFLPIERLRRTVAKIPFVHEGKEFHVTASFGVAWFAVGRDSAEDLIGRADAALYAAKDRGRDRVEYASTGT